MDGDGGPERTLRVDRLIPEEGPGTVARCRDFVRSCLARRGWLDDPEDEELSLAVEDVLLMASEVVTNACRHAGGPRQVTVAGDGRHLRVEVADGSTVLPAMQPFTGPDRPGGHGLRVLDQLSRGLWGSDPRSGGKVVWFEVVRPRSTWR